jgi:hypothetical protein
MKASSIQRIALFWFAETAQEIWHGICEYLLKVLTAAPLTSGVNRAITTNLRGPASITSRVRRLVPLHSKHRGREKFFTPGLILYEQQEARPQRR